MDNNFSGKRNLWLSKTEESFLRDCDINVYQASGPGGQKRNKKLSAVRLIHTPTGLTVTSEKSRSFYENKIDAVKKLKLNIAISIRGPKVTIDNFNVSKNNDKYYLLVAKIFDSLINNDYKIKNTAIELELSTSAFSKLLAKDERIWRVFNQERNKLGLNQLKN